MTRQPPSPAPIYAVPTGNGNQIRTVPVGGTDRISVYFSEDVDPSLFVVLDGIDATYVTTKTWYSARVLRINISAPIQRGGNIPGDKLKLTLQNVKKLGTTTALDGDWVNPDDLGDTTVNNYGKAISRYPSGDSNPGTDFVFWITVLPADYDGNNKVDLTDFGTHKANFGKANPTYAEGDGNGDGKIDLTDFGALQANFGTDWSTNW
jgi:hypothetical protein